MRYYRPWIVVLLTLGMIALIIFFLVFYEDPIIGDFLGFVIILWAIDFSFCVIYTLGCCEKWLYDHHRGAELPLADQEELV